MDLNLTDEQRMLRESAERFVSETCTSDYRRRAEHEGFSAQVWRAMAELGWLALPLPETYGGHGAGAVETGILMEAMGRGLMAEPYLATVVLGAGLVAEAGTDAQKQAILPRVASGEMRLAFAHGERASRDDIRRVGTLAVREGDGWRLDGDKIAALDAAAADEVIVSARIGDAAGPLGVFLVTPDTPGVVVADYPRLGGGRAANIQLRNAHLPAEAHLAGVDEAMPAVEAAIDRALAALGAEAVGMMQVLLDTTLDYTKVRKQFGRPLAANQVLRHRLTDMSVQVDEARSMALRAALKADAECRERSRAASGAKAKIGRCARFVAEQAVQLHGAMGVTEELEVGLYFKRLLAFETLLGSTGHHYRRHAELSAPGR